MTVLYYDCFSGISGDMNLGAMIDLGMDKDYLINELSKLHLNGYEIKVNTDMRKGIQGTKVSVVLTENHDHVHEHQHSYLLSPENRHHHHHAENRNLNDIEKIINESSLNEKVKALSLKMFKKIALAEAKIHGKNIEEVHFHEVGAVDSIVDIVGAAVAFDYFKPDKVLCSSIELGGGMVKCQHGLFPVPAPATAEILTGIPIKSGAMNFEATTPTGATILATLVNEFTDKINVRIQKTAYGIGHKDGEIPNVLRVHLAEGTVNVTDAPDASVMLECNIDDMSPELYEPVMELLFEAGADDVFLTPMIMKKIRPATKLSVLCSSMKEPAILDIIFKQTTTLGIRKYQVEKIMLRRNFVKIDTKWGKVTVKEAFYNNEMIKFKPEYEDCKRIAKENNISVKMVMDEVNRLYGQVINNQSIQKQ
jgi:pyridinium-3,5-bisthiocarboxylic acid mononucleotide nickel chelatase